jgi:uncharacterized protein YrrD
MPVMSLQTGAELAKTTAAIINPSNLTVVAYEVDGPTLDQNPSLLLVRDIREIGSIGMIIDSSDEFVGTDDIIKVKPLYDLHFTVLDKHVLDEHRKKLGKVVDYSIDVDSFVIQQLTVRRPLFKSLNDAELLVHRSQIVEINDTEIIVKSTADKAKRPVTQATHHFVNPFRQGNPQPESADIGKS